MPKPIFDDYFYSGFVGMSRKNIATELAFWNIPLTPAYVQRKANALAAGFTSSQARGHARKGLLAISDVKLAQKSVLDPALRKQNWLLIGTYKRQLEGDKDVVELYKHAKKLGWKDDPFWAEEESPMAQLINDLRGTIDKETGKKKGRKFKRGDKGESPKPVSTGNNKLQLRIFNEDDFEGDID